MNIEFVSYDGRYPNLCSGILTLNVNGVNKTFGYSDKCNYRSFWYTGGSTWFSDDYSEDHVDTNDWQINTSDLPKELVPYADVIAKLFNDNVPHGCCGGCL